jgi:3-oxoadipate enol-lactonase/4-carboxymuconolactone decarboxylase
MTGTHTQIDGPLGAPPLVLLNSMGTGTAMWDPQIAALAEQFRVIRIDARGHGKSAPSAPGTQLTLADLGADVLAVLDELGLQRVHLAGLSLGGMTAMWLAARHPERVDRLALLCTSAYLPPASNWLERAAVVRATGMTAIHDAVITRWITPGLAARDDNLVTRLSDMLAATDAESYAQCCEAVAQLDLRPDLGRIASPTLVIAGDEDPATPPPHAEEIVAGIAGSRVEVLSPAAHLATVEASGRIASLLLDHFGGGATTARGFATRRAVLGDGHVDRAIAGTTAFTRPFQDFITRYAWGDVWSRAELPRRERSMVTLAALITLGADHEIGLHVRAALRNGLTPDEISEVILHTALYAGLPRANRAYAIAQEVLTEPN